MMARQVARQFCRLGEVHSLVYGRRASGENGGKLTASTRVGLESRLMDYLGLNLICFGFAADTRAASESDRILHRVRNASSVLPSSRRKLHRCRINLSVEIAAHILRSRSHHGVDNSTCQ